MEWVRAAVEPGGYSEALRRSQAARAALWAWRDQKRITAQDARFWASQLGEIEARAFFTKHGP